MLIGNPVQNWSFFVVLQSLLEANETLAYSRTDEEQGMKTLHSHWQIWAKIFNKTRNALFHSDERERKAARDAFISYINQVVCASYGTDFVVTQNCGAEKEHDLSVTMPMHQILQEVEDKSTLRKAQHQDHCLDVKGKVLECKHCGESFSPSECIKMGVNHYVKNHLHQRKMMQTARLETHRIQQ